MTTGDEQVMQAAFYEQRGAAREVLKVGTLPRPEPGPGEVRVRVVSSGVNPSDVKSRRGATAMPYPRITPHSDGAGMVDALGPGVDSARMSERVWLYNAQWQRPFGTAAQFVVVPQDLAVAMPSSMAFDEGACMGVPALTAWHAVHGYGDVRGQRLLIAGGAGAVAHYAIQLAKEAGAWVATTVSSPEKAAHAVAAGADCVMNYKSDPVGQRLRDAGAADGVDRIIELDLAANAATYASTLRPRGSVVVYGSSQWNAPLPGGDFLVRGTTLHYFIVYNLRAAERNAAIAGLHQLQNSGRLQHRIAARFSLDRIADAHEAVEQGLHIGNVVVHPPQ